jgi:hypothetical protein
MIFFGTGCSKENKPTLRESNYTTEMAINNGDAVNIHGKKYNVEKLDNFIKNVEADNKDKIRITTYTVEGDPIITNLEYDGNNIIYTHDTTRDNFGQMKIEKKKFEKSSIYKSGSKYYLKDSPSDIWIF